MLNNTKPFVISYHFKTKEGKEFHYDVTLDPQSFENNCQSHSNDEWMNLEFHQCKNCPLTKEQSPQCPVAVGLSSFLNDFSDVPSYEEAEIQVDVEERSYLKKSGLQDGLFSLMGLIMATSSCPELSHLRTMARFHLPFATIDETIIRNLSFYLLQQYFLKRAGQQADLELNEFNQVLEKTIMVNEGVLGRIKAISSKDANSNSLVILDSFSKVLSNEMHRGFESIAVYFKS